MAVHCFIYLSPKLQEILTLSASAQWLAEMDIFTLQSLEITDWEKRKGGGGGCLFEVVWFTSLLHNLSFFQFFSLSHTHIIWRTLTHTRIGQTHNRSHNRGWGDEEVEDDDRLLLAIIISPSNRNPHRTGIQFYFSSVFFCSLWAEIKALLLSFCCGVTVPLCICLRLIRCGACE